MQPSLEHFIISAPPSTQDLPDHNTTPANPTDENDIPQPQLIAHSAKLHPSQMLQWHQHYAPYAYHTLPALALIRWRDVLPAPVPLGEQQAHEQASFFFVRLVARAETPVYHYCVLPYDDLMRFGGDLTVLISLLTDFEVPPPAETPHILAPLSPPAPTTWTLNKRVTLLSHMLEDRLQGRAGVLFSLLGCVIADGVTLRNYPPALGERLSLINALIMLLPSPARHLLTFTTQAMSMTSKIHPRVMFDDAPDPPATSTRPCFDWSAMTFDTSPPTHAYDELLKGLWAGDVVTFAEQLRALDPIAFSHIQPTDISAGLDATARRYQLDWQVQTLAPTGDDNLDSATLLGVLQGSTPPEGVLRRQYVLHLLAHALRQRDNLTAGMAIEAIDADPELNELASQLFQTKLDSEPDAVYAVVRVRCNASSSAETDMPWLARLRQAALRALHIALNASDADSLGAWLRLLSREPMSFGLADIVREGVLRALPRAPESPELTRILLVIALKRTPDLLDTLLRDAHMLPALPPEDALGRALLHNDTSAIESLAEASRELFLLAVATALESEEATLNSAIIRTLWDLQASPIAIIEAYKPAYLLERLPQSPPHIFHKGALETLLRLHLIHEDDEAFHTACAHLARQGVLTPLLSPVLLQSDRNLDSLLVLLNQLITRDILVMPAPITVALDILTELDWVEEALPLAELLSRWLNQQAQVTVTGVHLWKLLELGNLTHSEVIARTTVGRILQNLSEQSMGDAEIAQLIRCRQLTQWSHTTQERIMNWWRRYTREHALSDLQKLDKALINQRGMEDLRAVVHTTSAIRRAIGKRTLDQLAEHISVTHSLLLAFADNFDPDNKQSLEIDTATISDLLEARQEELDADKRQVLVTNLRGLVQLITTMAENRSKPSLMRSENAIERQLATGEQAPQSAVDVLRWLATYLETSDGD